MNEALIQVLNRIPGHALLVLLFLQQRVTLDTKVGVTQQEIARAAGLHVLKVREALGWLEEPNISDSMRAEKPDLGSFCIVRPYSKAHKITLCEPYSREAWVRFTFEDTDERKIQTLERELHRLATQNKQRSRLSLVIQGKPQQLIAEIESDMGRPCTQEEAYLLGALVDGFGPDRIKAAWRKHAANLDQPVRGIYAMFQKKRFGDKTQMEEQEKEVRYQKVSRDDELL